MTVNSFVDTNVLIYRAIPLPQETGKAATAERILSEGSICLSVQVLQEFYV